MPFRRWLLVCSALLWSGAWSVTHAAALEQASITLAVGGPGLFYYLPVTIAQQRGYFAAEGLDVEIVDFPGGAKSLQAVVGGSADFAAGSFEHVLRMQAKDQPLRAITLLARYPAMVLALATPAFARYHTFTDLRGMKIGVTAPGSSTQIFLNQLLVRNGMPPDAVAVIGVGASAGAVAALRHGDIDGLVHLDPVISQLEASGDIRVIVDTRTPEGVREVYGGTYHAACLYAKADFLDSHPLTTQALVNAQVRALRWLVHATPAQIVDTMPPTYWGGDRAAYQAALVKNLAIVSPDGVLDDAGAQHVLTALMASDPALRATPPKVALAIDNSFVNRVAPAQP